MTTSTGDALADADTWMGHSGESAGTCNGGRTAGTFWTDYANGLAQRAPQVAVSTLTADSAAVPVVTPLTTYRGLAQARRLVHPGGHRTSTRWALPRPTGGSQHQQPGAHRLPHHLVTRAM